MLKQEYSVMTEGKANNKKVKRCCKSMKLRNPQRWEDISIYSSLDKNKGENRTPEDNTDTQHIVTFLVTVDGVLD
jgi:hypothetical protein